MVLGIATIAAGLITKRESKFVTGVGVGILIHGLVADCEKYMDTYDTLQARRYDQQYRKASNQ